MAAGPIDALVGEPAGPLEILPLDAAKIACGTGPARTRRGVAAALGLGKAKDSRACLSPATICSNSAAKKAVPPSWKAASTGRPSSCPIIAPARRYRGPGVALGRRQGDDRPAVVTRRLG